jgi:hypothetical protein
MVDGWSVGLFRIVRTVRIIHESFTTHALPLIKNIYARSALQASRVCLVSWLEKGINYTFFVLFFSWCVIVLLALSKLWKLLPKSAWIEVAYILEEERFQQGYKELNASCLEDKTKRPGSDLLRS